MERKRIKQLSDKYWKANTNLQEEEELKKSTIESLNSPLEDVEGEYFQLLNDFGSQSLDDDFDVTLLNKIERLEENRPSIFTKKWIRMAAIIVIASSLALVLGARTYQNQQSVKMERQLAAREAFETTKAMLMMVSVRLEKGKQHTLTGLVKMEETRNKVYKQNSSIN